MVEGEKQEMGPGSLRICTKPSSARYVQVDMSGLRILHLISQRPDSTGSGVYVQAMLREAVRRGHRNHLLAAVQADCLPDAPEVTGCQCAFVCFQGADSPLPIAGMSDVMPYASRRFCDMSAADVAAYEACFSGKLQAAVERFSPDLIHSHHLWLLTSLAKRLFPDVPLAVTCHGTDLRQFRNCPHLRERVLAGCAGVEAVMALSRAQKQDIVELYGLPEESVQVVGAGYDETLFYFQDKPAPPPVAVVYAGKLCNAKGTPCLLEALAGMDGVPWRLHLVGGGAGDEADRCRDLARRLGDRVRLYGSVDQRRLAAIMKKGHVFVLPSFFEGLPLVLLEALACGCRVVATDLPGVAEVLDGLAVDYIQRVGAPRLRCVDQPLAEDQERFVADLRSALTAQAIAAMRQPAIDLAPIQNRLTSFTWRRVFERVERVYQFVLGR